MALSTGAGTSIAVPVVLPESILVVPLVAVPFTAFCVIVGMNWSLRSKGTIGAVMATVGVVGAIAGTVGLCAWKAEDIGIIGPVLAALSPASAVYACIQGDDALAKTAIDHGLTSARTGLVIGALISCAAHVAVVMAVRSAMTRNFDVTVRKLAGTK